jgi:hypothetical protein
MRTLRKHVAWKEARLIRHEQEAIEAMNAFVDDSGDEVNDM